ncbi:CxxxxCH/CxxCH domain-containing protein [Anaeromyxobacter sp. Fw109-5]|uniref:CxxxxCH/CxxCH domain c-type cytochrome n=1 Tax=Anaeromyxobacter sp. (strain Fw109-5) TaxID=404589 RepID=UPI0000ED781F|nr:CxxxxCH/CxxCH domain-containing protein [Anaeromyxobacter sp. Fw109-5]ABS24447.1 cytochrome C family protein [Anaeromyxobacter sp. Fw109-5]
MARITLGVALRAAAVTLLVAAACESRAPLPRRQRVEAGPCDTCHAAPPATGAHLAHVAPAALDGLAYGDLRVLEDVATGGTRYAFGCGHCHPVDEAAHEADLGDDGLPDVVLTPPVPLVAGDVIKARNTPQAGWDSASGSCSGVYCHSSGQGHPEAQLEYRATPAWTAAPGTLGCGGCHGNPPGYASSGPGATSAAPNSHIQLAEDGSLAWEWGHYAGMPGPYHYPLHGSPTAGFAAAPITCQTCHFETVDPAHTTPGGFYYLDTSGDYALDGGDPARLSHPSWARTQCVTCHGEGLRAPAAGGAVLPLRHVNGRPDVAFDRRSALPDGYVTGLPALATTAPIAPYYVSPFNVSMIGWELPPGSEIRLTETGKEVLTVSLEQASYDPATRTCSNVGCHLGRQSMVNAGYPPLQWGEPYVRSVSCDRCHSMF